VHGDPGGFGKGTHRRARQPGGGPRWAVLTNRSSATVHSAGEPRRVWPGRDCEGSVASEFFWVRLSATLPGHEAALWPDAVVHLLERLPRSGGRAVGVYLAGNMDVVAVIELRDNGDLGPWSRLGLTPGDGYDLDEFTRLAPTPASPPTVGGWETPTALGTVRVFHGQR
jgi:hypothetical protein